MPDIEVADVHEAVALARKGQATGEYAWFRGQNRCWPLVSSLARRSSQSGREGDYEMKLARFCRWLEDVEELRHLLEPEHVHAFFAVLQHYGVPTHYIDFSTSPEVAGFFAAVGPDVDAGEKGCILCIDPDRMTELLRISCEVQEVPRKAWPEKIEVEVPNLWRMQAQSGHFLYLPMTQVESVYGYDRIVFPHDGAGYSIAKTEIYPERQSALEILLDRFFLLELMIDNHGFIKDLFEQHEVPQPLWRNEGEPLLAALEIHPSWTDLDPKWRALPDERFEQVRRGGKVMLPSEPTHDLGALRARVTRAVQTELATNPLLRSVLVDWTLEPVAPPAADDPRASEAERIARRTWDGMRGLPYSDEQLALAIGTGVAYAFEPLAPGSVRKFSLFENEIRIEMATAEGVNTRALAPAIAVQRAFREDLPRRIRGWRADIDPSAPKLVLQVANDPRRAMVFERLVDLFASALVPLQVGMQTESHPVFFSPAVLTVLGLA